MKTKLLCLVVALIAVIAMLASCGGGGTTPGGGPDGGGDGGDGKTAWTKTDITVKLTNHSNSNELSSGCKRYYAGQDTSAFLEIDQNIKARNQLAVSTANVKVKYDYIEDSESKGWGANINDMVGDVNSGSQNLPDIYCNFAYDMTCAALRRCFSNLLATEGYTYGNQFRFVESDYKTTLSEDDYFNSAAGEGYFYQYMRSLSLTPDTKLYCLASNYTIDVMRSFLVMPVNVSIIESMSVENGFAGDRDDDGDHDIEDFYDLVWKGGWDYNALAAYSRAAYIPGSGADSATDLSDNRVGLALGRGSGLTSSGLLYTTSVKILEVKKEGNEIVGYEYPASNSGLNEVATALYNLISGNESLGICVVDKAEAQGVDASAKTELEAIRNRFANGNVLFGGIIAVGSLEDKVYQDMKTTGDKKGFGVVPVPVYKAGEEYKTLVHNLARIMAISKASTKFSQCSAFLDYQSRNSAAILEDYYGQQLTAAVGGLAGEQNSKMLTYIRNHVNDCFDKTFEDAIANKAGETDANATSTRFHGYLMNNDYKVSSFSIVYDAVCVNKQGHLDSIWNDWISLDSYN